MANPRRGEVDVDLGDLGKFTARADFNAVAEIEAVVDKVGRLFIGLPELAVGQKECVQILFSTVRAFDQRSAPTYEQIAEEVSVMGLARAIGQVTPLLAFMIEGFQRTKADVEGKKKPETEPAKKPTPIRSASSSESPSSTGESSRRNSGA